ncbi:MAG: response regulator [Alphaproteobacteria bacterium]|nr:response regulator [Alphaproteobacteria bacterium]
MAKVKYSHFSIRTMLLAIISILNVLIAAPAAYRAYISLIEHHHAQEIGKATEFIAHFYRVKKFLSAERAAALSILYVPSSSFDALSIDLRENRIESEKAFNEGMNFLKNNPELDLQPAIQNLRKSYTALQTLRLRIDVAMTLPPEKRDFPVADLFFDQATAVVLDINELIDSYTRPITSYNPNITRQLRFTRLIWEISEYAGREYAVLGQLIAQNKFPSPEIQEKLTLWHNRTQYGLELAHGSLYSSSWREEIVSPLDEAETHYFMTFEQIHKAFYQPQTGQPEAVYPLSVELWLQLASQVVDSLHSLADIVLNVNQKSVMTIKADSEREILLSFFLFVSALGLSLYTWWIITARVIRPVNSMIDKLYSETNTIRPELTSNTNPDEIGKLSQVLEVFQENTRQLQKERDKAQMANIAKSEFLANMSHEIRTPMNVVVGLTNILGRSSPLTAKQTEFIHTLEISAGSLLALINDLLDFSKIEAHKFELEKISFDLRLLMEEVVAVISVKAREKNLILNTDLDDIQDEEFIGDPTRIRQILINILGNAVKFTSQGTVSLNVRIQENLRPGYRTAFISISDTGPGIAPDKLSGIFEKFTQADSTITRKFGGTGLGLAITKSLVDLMDGDIHVESCPGEGATFLIKIPLLKSLSSPPRLTAPEMQKLRHSSPSQKKILLVEDYLPNIIVTGTFLEQFGYEYDSAENGQEAVRKFMEGAYGVILMDVQMPEMDGYETTKAIRAYEQTNNLKPVIIIGLTAHASVKDRESCLRTGMDDYLSKPFDPATLQEKLRTAMKK